MQAALENFVSKTGIEMDNALDQVTTVCVCVCAILMVNHGGIDIQL
jgi:hypothetical protein